jgi:hypothetical protein
VARDQSKPAEADIADLDIAVSFRAGLLSLRILSCETFERCLASLNCYILVGIEIVVQAVRECMRPLAWLQAQALGQSTAFANCPLLLLRTKTLAYILS